MWEKLFFVVCWAQMEAMSMFCENFTKSASHRWVSAKTCSFVPVVLRCSSFSLSAWCLTGQTNHCGKNPQNDWLASLLRWHKARWSPALPSVPTRNLRRWASVGSTNRMLGDLHRSLALNQTPSIYRTWMSSTNTAHFLLLPFIFWGDIIINRCTLLI